MSEPVLLGSVTNALWKPYKHERTELRYKTYANGTKHLFSQCMVCGGHTGRGSALPQTDVDMSQVPPWDETLADQHMQREHLERQGKLRQEKRARHLEYEAYIRNSDQWWEIRTKVMRRDNNWCQACLDAPATEVHHKTYEHLYREILWELEAVCSQCHKKIHGLLTDDLPDQLRDTTKMVREAGEGE